MSSLVLRNVTIAGHRTSVRLEPSLWQALEEICNREETDLNDLCSEIAGRPRHGGFTSALREFIVSYYRGMAGGVTRNSAMALR